MSDNRGSVVGGVILIMLGLAFLGMQVFDASGGALVPLGLGVAFMVAHGVYRTYGFLVPGGILTGLGGGLLLEEARILAGEPVVLGLGAGFVLIWLVDTLITRSGPRQGSWWPLIPGGILSVIGIGSMVPDVTRDIAQYLLPIALIGLGVLVIVRGIKGRGSAS